MLDANTIDFNDLDFNNLDYRLEHLEKNQIIDLINEYYNNKNVKTLINKYNLTITNSNLYKILPSVYSTDLCEYCNENMLIPLSSKSSPDILDSINKYCPNCNHKSHQFYCNCLNCKKREEELQKEKQLYLNQILDESNWNKVDELSLNEETRLYLSIILKAGLSENTMYIEPLINYKDTLAPTDKFETELINYLISQNVIVPHPISDINEFKITENGVSYGIYSIAYRINIKPLDNNYDEMVKRLLYPESELFSNDFCYTMWKKISYFECLQYLLFQMKKVRYNFNPGKKTELVLEQLLESFSVAQIYNIIFRAIANSTSRYQSGDITKIHAQNSVISSCEFQGQRAKAEKWDLKGYGRIRELPETHISKTLFNSIMGISALGFYEVPTDDL